MNQQVLEQIYHVVDELKQTSDYKRLLELHKIIASSDDIKSKVQAFKRWNDKYNDVKQYGKYHPDLKATRQSFANAKAALYNEPVVAEYKQLEQSIQEQLDTISRTIAKTISPKVKYPNEVGLIRKH